jgi:hypothetical protein
MKARYCMSEGDARTEDTRSCPQGEDTMAGYVRGHVEIHGDRSYDLVPVVCPAADEHTAGVVRCFTCHADGWFRSCVYFVSGCENDNVTSRVHPSSLAERAMSGAMRQIRAGCICQRQRGNRPPGC